MAASDQHLADRNALLADEEAANLHQPSQKQRLLGATVLFVGLLVGAAQIFSGGLFGRGLGGQEHIAEGDMEWVCKSLVGRYGIVEEGR